MISIPRQISSADRLPPGLVPPEPVKQPLQCLFKISLATGLARLGVSVDDVRRWHGHGWLSFDENLTDQLDEYDDPRIWETQIVRDIVRSALTDAQIEVLFSTLPKPFVFYPDSLVYSFRHGWACVIPPVKIPPVEMIRPSDIIDDHLDEWIDECDEVTLEILRDKITETLEAREAVEN